MKKLANTCCAYSLSQLRHRNLKTLRFGCLVASLTSPLIALSLGFWGKPSVGRFISQDWGFSKLHHPAHEHKLKQQHWSGGSSLDRRERLQLSGWPPLDRRLVVSLETSGSMVDRKRSHLPMQGLGRRRSCGCYWHGPRGRWWPEVLLGLRCLSGPARSVITGTRVHGQAKRQKGS